MSAWSFINDIFRAKEAKTGGIVRRQISDVEKNGGLPEILKEVRERRFHLIETGDQYVVICNTGVLKIHC